MSKGRGRLTKLEMLPEECAPIVAWAAEELQDRSRTQFDIYQEFVAKLEELDREYHGELNLDIPSFRAFSRYSVKLATVSARLLETREIASALATRFDPQASDNLTLIAAEAIKSLVFELLTNKGAGGIDPKGAMQLSAALRAAAQAQGVSTTRRQKIESEFAEKVDQAVETVAQAKGLTRDTVADIKAKVLGVSRA